ncbi:L-asparaginase precursor protein [Rutstroemia sp. NJR-2017a BBW]|nr:L-asparaginase precursor protein [Rutstroemia sp. NJR-2017a BBW]
MEYKPQSSSSSQKITPRIIIHGGAGNILPVNLPPAKYKLYHDSLLKILSNTHHFLTSPSSFPLASSSNSITSALDAVTFAVTQLEDNPLFNSGHGAVFTRDGINELEVSIMVSKGKKKRGVGLMGLQHVKNPIKLAREMLIRGERDLEGEEDKKRSSGAQGHSQLHKYSAEKLAKEWGLEIVDEKYFFVQARWDEHISGLEKERKGQGVASWDAKDFISQGTCGAVALDADGVLCVGTSTGAPVLELTDSLRGLLADCLPSLRTYSPVPSQAIDEKASRELKTFRSAAMSGTGNGDSFLRVAAVRTASAIARYRPHTSLQSAVTEITGPGGELVKSAGDRWKKTGEGEGGIIGIESKVVVDEVGRTKEAVADVVYDYNCGGMFRAWVNGEGKAVMRVWREGQYDGLEIYEGEGKEYEVAEWVD